MKTKKFITLLTTLLTLTALLLTLTLLPTLIAAEFLPCGPDCKGPGLCDDPCTLYPTPAGYHDNDYQKLIAFALQDDNAAKLGLDLSAPDTWWDSSVGVVLWNDSAPKRATVISFFDMDLTGRLDLSEFAALYHVNVRENNLTAVNVSGCTALEIIDVGVNRLTAIDLSTNTALTGFGAEYNRLQTLDLSNNPMLQVLNVRGNNLRALNLSNNTALVEVLVQNNQLTSLDVSACPDVEILDAENNRLTEFISSNNPQLRILSLQNNQLQALDLSRYVYLSNLCVSNNKLTSLDISNSTTYLSNLEADNNRLRELDISNNQQLRTVHLSDNLISDISSLEDLPNLQRVTIDKNLLDLDDTKTSGAIAKIQATVQYWYDWQKNIFDYPGIEDDFYVVYTPQKCLECEVYPCICCEVCGTYPCICPKPPSGIPTNTDNASENAAEYTKGDVNGDGKITTLDALLVLKHIAGKAPLTGPSLTAADINSDGKVETSDAVAILKIAAN